MAIAIAPERLVRALNHVYKMHEVKEPLCYRTALNILHRTNSMIEGKNVGVGEKHDFLRVAAAREPLLSEEQAALYRKVIHAYWLFAPKREKAES